MGAITIRGIDNEIAKILRERAKKEGTSVNSILLKTIRESLGLAKKKRTIIYDDLDYLAGTWTDKDYLEFKKKIADFEVVDEKMWR